MIREQIIRQVKSIILKYAKPERIYLYGSQANGEASKNSDIDIAYDDPDFKEHYRIEEGVNKINTLIKLDVKNIAHTEERFKNRVKSTSRVLYSATKELRAEDGLYNFSNALKRLVSVVERKEALIEDGFEDVYLDIVVKRFEFTYEMAWKALKRYLEFLGLDALSPRSTFKEAYSQGLLQDQGVWLDMIEQRNLSSHIYDESQIKELLEKVDRYCDAFVQAENEIQKGLGGQLA
ncbi:hypothetical protein MNBD_GAMMA04-545 [hydrothermal vent metagenome]|uniref:Polymerase beta nucleotidyltransferase domain-containing protein n=1 Tax=hydrothermal vent metagenome TaxID=652676 RepID=A0A3B0W9E7_9ZZZZ